MLSLIPTLSLDRPPAAVGLSPKFGGLPWGLPKAHWPCCRECGQPMSLLAQLPVRDGLDQIGPLHARADLADLVLHLFKCEGDDICSFWEPDAGTNAAFFLRTSDLEDDPALAPAATVKVLPEVWITDWTPYDDLVPPEAVDKVRDPTWWLDLTDEARFPKLTRTKLGGIPWWTGNGPQQVPESPFVYLLQIDQFLEIAGSDDCIEFGNFCSDGTCYVFIDPTAPLPGGVMFINR